MQQYLRGGVAVTCADVRTLYDCWQTPTVIVSDGAYGIKGFVGDPASHKDLPDWYGPHIDAWSRKASTETTLWFWNTEVGWATVHPLLESTGWQYRSCNIWNKGIAHAAGNSNTKTLRKFPVVTEVCVHYVRKPKILCVSKERTLRDWLREEWRRTELPFSKANEACGVKDAATRKYLATDHNWYFPPAEVFSRLVEYANRYGVEPGRPYFSVDGQKPLSAPEWERYRGKFHCPVAVTNVWDEPAVRGGERVRGERGYLHANQKPAKLIERIVQASSDHGDCVWEPFGGLCTVALVCCRLGRRCEAAEVDRRYYEASVGRLEAEVPTHERR